MKTSTVVKTAAAVGATAYAYKKFTKFHQTKITCMFKADSNKVFDSLKNAIAKCNYRILEEDYENKAILFKTGLSMSTFGQRVIAGIIDLSDKTKKCPECAEDIKIEARKCRYCGESFHKGLDVKNIVSVGCIAQSGQMYDWDEKEFITYNVMKNLNELLDPEEKDDKLMGEGKQLIDSIRTKQIRIKSIIFGGLGLFFLYVFYPILLK